MEKFKVEPIQEIHTKIRGVTYDDPASGVNRQDIIRAFVKPGTKLELRPEATNPVDSEAIAVWLRNKSLLMGKKEYHLGYLSHELAHEMRTHLAQGIQPVVTVLGVTGGTKEQPTRGVNIVIRF